MARGRPRRRRGGSRTGTGRRRARRGPTPPGEHGAKRRRQPSIYAQQLRETQKLKHAYGVRERQFRRYVDAADLDDARREQVFEGNIRRVYPRLDARLGTR